MYDAKSAPDDFQTRNSVIAFFTWFSSLKNGIELLPIIFLITRLDQSIGEKEKIDNCKLEIIRLSSFTINLFKDAIIK